MNKRRGGCWLAVFSLFSIKMYSVPAYPHKVLYKFGDSTEVSIRLKGDEYNKWALTTDNYTLLPSGNEWYFAKADSMGNAVRSGYKLCADAERPESLRRFLAQQPKGLRPMVDEAQKKRLSYRNRAVEKRGRHAAVVGERRALVILMSFADVASLRPRRISMHFSTSRVMPWTGRREASMITSGRFPTGSFRFIATY